MMESTAALTFGSGSLGQAEEWSFVSRNEQEAFRTLWLKVVDGEVGNELTGKELVWMIGLGGIVNFLVGPKLELG